MKFTIEQLKLADELCFQDDAKRLFKKHFPEFWMIYIADFSGKYECDLMRWVFSWSRGDMGSHEREVGDAIDAMIQDILGDNDHE